MKARTKKRWVVGLLLLAVLLYAAFLWQRPLLNVGSGYAAKHACSCHFLQGRALEEIRENDLNFSVLGNVSLDKRGGEIHASFFGLVPRRAVFVEGAGCVLVNDEHRDLPAGYLGAVAGAGVADTAAAVSVNPELAAALERGMEPVPGGGARGIVVLQDGKLIGETYAPGFDPETRMLGWSMTKSLTGLAVGAWLARPSEPPAFPQFYGTIAAAAPKKDRLFPEWTDARANITLENLLQMNSGLAWQEAYGGLTDATIMLHERADMARYVIDKPLLHPIGDHWAYSSGTTNALMELLRRGYGDNQTLYAHLYDSLFHPVAPSLLIEPDQSGRPVGSSYGWATTRDWARLGQLMLRDGVWNGDTLLPPGWVDYLRQPANGSDSSYGGHLWLPGPDLPDFPPDGFMMRGFQDQRVFVLPTERVVIARLGHNEDKVTDFNWLVQDILAAL